MIKVLIVDDSSLTREFHSAIIIDAGFTCITASDGNEGLEKVASDNFNIILTDINMQGMDGYEFIRRVRQLAAYDDVPIVIISTECQERDRQKGFNVGANLYLVKPINPRRMISAVGALVGTLPLTVVQ